MSTSRRDLLRLALTGTTGWSLSGSPASAASSADRAGSNGPLTIKRVRITPVALPDPPLLASSGCHGPYFLRNLVEIETDAGITGIGETKGGEFVRQALEKAASLVVGKNAFRYREFAREVSSLSSSTYAGIELACLDACGRATGRRVCELLGGPVREQAEFSAYLFYRYAADNPALLQDSRVVDDRGRGDKSLDGWGEVRTPDAMAAMAEGFRRRWGFRVFKLKAGVLSPDEELATLHAIHERLGKDCPLRIDPNARWTMQTAVRIGQAMLGLPIEYYEDPVSGREDMARVRIATGHRMSTNMCVTEFAHVPEAVRLHPVDVVLGDHHGWGGLPAFLELGRLCETFGWGLSQHSNNHAGVTMAAMIHIAATVPQLTYPSDTHYPWLPEGADVIAGPNLPIVAGHMRVPEGAGLGVELDRDRLAAAHEVWEKCGMRERDDATTMQLVQPGWKRTPL